MGENRYSTYTTTRLPNGGKHVRYHNGSEGWYNSDGMRHRLDGSAVITLNGQVEYWVNGKIPIHIMDILIIPELIDYEMFPSACVVSKVHYPYNIVTHLRYHAYRLDSHDLALAILWINRG